MGNVIAVTILIIVIGLALYHIYKERKKGNKCIGCSCAGSCVGECGALHKTDVGMSKNNDNDMK